MADSGILELGPETLDVHLCIICQKQTNECLVDKPVSHEKVFKSIEEWARYGKSGYKEVWRKLARISPRELVAKGTSWHRSCYKDDVHTAMLKREKERFVLYNKSSQISRPCLH